MSKESDFAWTGELQKLNQQLDNMRNMFAHIRHELHYQPFTFSWGQSSPVPALVLSQRCILRGMYAANGGPVSVSLTDGKGGPARAILLPLPLTSVEIFFGSGICVTAVTGQDDIFFYGSLLS